MRSIPAGREAADEAARIVKRGGVIAFPTDTVYGLGCDPSSDEAVARLFKIKGRQAKPVPLLCASPAFAGRIVELNAAAKKLGKLHWPGALTIVAPLKKASRLSPLLHQGSGNLGVRVPKGEFCQLLASNVGGAITGTSANLSGQPSCRTAAQVIDSLDGSVDLVVDGGELKGRESTVVKVVGGTVEVLREGSVRIQEGELKP